MSAEEYQSKLLHSTSSVSAQTDVMRSEHRSSFMRSKSYRSPAMASNSLLSIGPDQSDTPPKRNGSFMQSASVKDMKCIQEDLRELIEFEEPLVMKSTASTNVDPLFTGLARGKGHIDSEFLVGLLNEMGLNRKDARLGLFFKVIDQVRNKKIDSAQLKHALSENGLFIRRALTGRLIIPDFKGFCDDFTEIFDKVKEETSGHVASYIPTLASVNPKFFAASVCTVDGQTFSIGDDEEKFCIQSCVKPFLYLLALNENGREAVHRRIGQEPSGQRFNVLSLKDIDVRLKEHKPNGDGTDPIQIPHNPMINSGAIMSTSMINPDETRSERLKTIMCTLGDMAGNTSLMYDRETYVSEKETADRNRALAYMMREEKAFPQGTDVQETLNLYFQSCSIMANCNQMATIASTLANGGICPLTNKHSFDAEHVRHCLALMLSCGMYDYSGSWAFKIGVPAKSGVGGSILIVIPNKLGICIWSPRIDNMGNSVRGVAFAKELIRRFNFHHLDNVSAIKCGSKKDPCLASNSQNQYNIGRLLFAASRGDLVEIIQMASMGFDLFKSDYDDRTALHVASSLGHIPVVEYLIRDETRSLIPPELINKRDTFGFTAADDAVRRGHTELLKILQKAGGIVTTKASLDSKKVGGLVTTKASLNSKETNGIFEAKPSPDSILVVA